jgi:hypothetical protein
MSVALFNNLTVLTPSDKLSALAATTSAELAGVISDETGSGALVFGTSPTFTTQITVPKIVATSNALDIQPTTDATTAIQLNDKDGNAILNVDTTNDRVGIGTTGPSAMLHIQGSTGIRLKNSASATSEDYIYPAGDSGGLILKTDSGLSTSAIAFGFQTYSGGYDSRLVILGNGYVGIGTTSPSNLLEVMANAPSASVNMKIRNSSTSGAASLMINAPSATDTKGVIIRNFGGSYSGNSDSGALPLANSTLFAAAGAAGDFIFNPSTGKGYLFEIGTSAAMRIVSSGNVGIGAAAPTGGGTPALALAQASANPINIGINTAGLIAKDNGGTCELYAWDEAGNVTQISPHSAGLLDDLPLSYELPFVFHSENKYLGRAICVDMFGALRAVEQLSGKKFITLEDVPQGNWEDDARDAAARFNRDELQKLMARQVEVPKEHALERVEITEEIPTEETEQTGKWLIDSDGAVITETRHKTIKRATGRYHWQPRTGIHFDAANGKFYRTLTETEAAEIFTPQEPKPCPKWIASRLEAK